MRLLTFTLDQQRCALPLSGVDSVVRAAQIRRLPNAPPIVSGVINVHGRIVPVINMRYRLNLPERRIEPADQFILAHTARRPVCLIVDAVTEVDEYPEHSLEAADSVLPNLEFIAGVMKLPEGLVLIHDLDRFLSLEEEMALDRALT